MKPVTQAIILAAGASSRTYPLTIQRPKPLLPILNQPLLQHHLEQLDGLVEEVILVVGFERQQIRQAFGNSFKRLKLTYCVQDQNWAPGTRCCKPNRWCKIAFSCSMVMIWFIGTICND